MIRALLPVALAPVAVAQLGCIALHCPLEYAKCFSNATCRSLLGCSANCAKGPLLEFVGCVGGCGVQYGPNDLYEEANNCTLLHHCSPDGPKETCNPPPMADRVPIKLKDDLMDRDWWAVAGMSPLMDRSKCQRRRLSTRTNTTFFYEVDSLVPTPSIGMQNWTLPQMLEYTPEQRSNSVLSSWKFTYMKNALQFTEEWFILANTEEYLQVYYCLNTDSWGNMAVGSLVLARRNRALSSLAKTDLDVIAARYAKIPRPNGTGTIDFGADFLPVGDTCHTDVPAAFTEFV